MNRAKIELTGKFLGKCSNFQQEGLFLFREITNCACECTGWIEPGGTWRSATMPRFEHRNGLLFLLLDGIPFLFSSSSSKIELPRHLDAQIAWYNAGILPFPMPDISTWPKRIDPRILDRDTELEPVASIYIPDIEEFVSRNKCFVDTRFE